MDGPYRTQFADAGKAGKQGNNSSEQSKERVPSLKLEGFDSNKKVNLKLRPMTPKQTPKTHNQSQFTPVVRLDSSNNGKRGAPAQSRSSSKHHRSLSPMDGGLRFSVNNNNAQQQPHSSRNTLRLAMSKRERQKEASHTYNNTNASNSRQDTSPSRSSDNYHQKFFHDALKNLQEKPLNPKNTQQQMILKQKSSLDNRESYHQRNHLGKFSLRDKGAHQSSKPKLNHSSSDVQSSSSKIRALLPCVPSG